MFHSRSINLFHKVKTMNEVALARREMEIAREIAERHELEYIRFVRLDVTRPEMLEQKKLVYQGAKESYHKSQELYAKALDMARATIEAPVEWKLDTPEKKVFGRYLYSSGYIVDIAADRCPLEVLRYVANLPVGEFASSFGIEEDEAGYEHGVITTTLRTREMIQNRINDVMSMARGQQHST